MARGTRDWPTAFPTGPKRDKAVTPDDLRRSLFLGPDDIRNALSTPRRVARSSLFASKPATGETTQVPATKPTLPDLDQPPAAPVEAEAGADDPAHARRLSLITRITRYFGR